MKVLARGLAIWGAWTLFALFSASQMYMSGAYGGGRSEFLPSLKYAAIDCYVWAALTPLAFWVAGRLVVRRANFWWTLPVLLVAGLVFGLIHLNVFVRLLPLIGYRNSFRVQQTIMV